MCEEMIPIGKAMAEALLLESDESTVSLSETSIEMDCFEDTKFTLPVRYPNSPSRTYIRPHHERRGKIESGFKTADDHFPHLSRVTLPDHHTSSFAASRYVALDCEMVGVGPGGKRSVLARVSIVDYFGKCLFDRFVRVEERVTDFRHHVTGITSKDLSSVNALPFGRCRQHVITIIRNKVLVGHALENDLAVLGIHHPWHDIRDTSMYHPYLKEDRFGRMGPSRLAHLAKIHLGIDIQRRGHPHCPVEDSCAAMALYRKNQPFWDALMEHQRHNTAHM